jgi:formylglycine-generating enzyme required for sulfatase activity
LSAACGGDQRTPDTPEPTPFAGVTDTARPEPTAVAEVTKTSRPEPTATGVPPAETPEPEPTPAATATPTSAPPSPTPTPDVPVDVVRFATDDGADMAATLFGEGDIAVLLLHQGYGSADQRTWHPFARQIAEQGFAALTLDFRGRGGSEGRLIDDYRYKDARGAVEYLRSRGYERLICMGAGIWGGEPCLRLGLEGELEGLVLIAAPMSSGPVESAAGQELSQLTIPKLFVYGEKDGEGVPEGMNQLYQAVAEPKDLVTYDSAARGTQLFRSPFGDDFREVLLGFLEGFRSSSGVTYTSVVAGNEAPASATLGDAWVRPADGMLTLYVPGGTFQMGSSEAEIDAQLARCEMISAYCTRRFYREETPQHEVTVDGFWMDQTEVTNAQFAVFLNEHGTHGARGERYVVLDQGYLRIREEEGSYVPMGGAADHPVVMVTWHGADTYCQSVGGRLPTEAEWEYAARGPEGNIYPWGSELPTCELANSGACNGTTAPAAGLPDGASWCGVLGMAGNAWEWTMDRFERYSAAPQENPTGAAEGIMRVLRGGGWHANQWMTRSTFRLHDAAPSGSVGCIGFRCVVPAGAGESSE